VHVIAQKPLGEFGRKHSDARARLRSWLSLVQNGHFQNLPELKLTLAQVDMVPVKGPNLYVFNIGNKYRLIASIDFSGQRLSVRHVLTHAEYDTERWKR
jgi:mRNA interferase HigB